MKFRLTSLFLLLGILADAQSDSLNFRPPMDIPMYVSGNFGEMRSNHFHTGVDIKTQGRTGIPLKAVERGWVSRIKVSTGGYGNALYIDHPGGITSVYAHMDAFNEEITAFLREAQYDLEEYCVYLYPTKNQLPIEKGETIGLSGNTGHSGGPHLHFEFRDTESEHPLNPQAYTSWFSDEVKPSVHGIMIIPLEDQAQIDGIHDRKVYYSNKSTGNCILANQHVPEIHGKVGFAIKTVDKYSDSNNPCATYSIKLYQDEELIYHQEFNELCFETNRYVNAHMVYDYYKNHKSRFERNFLLPNNELGIYQLTKNNGTVDVVDNKKHRFRYELTDYNGNTTSLSFDIQGVERKNTDSSEIKKEDKCTLFQFGEDSRFSNENCMVFVPKGRLYDDYCFEYRYKSSVGSAGIHHLGESTIPLQNDIVVKLKVDSLYKQVDPKHLTAVRLQGKKVRAVKSDFTQGWIEFRTRTFGSYSIRVDSVAPVIKPSQFQSNMKGKKSMSFNITDNLSGILNYDIFIDGKWVLGEYLPSKARLSYTFDPTRLQQGNHQVEVRVEDAVGNINSFTSTFDW